MMIMKASTDSASTVTSDGFLEDLEKKVQSAIESREAKDIAIVQLEVQFAMLQYLQRLDWKLWEFYNKFVI